MPINFPNSPANNDTHTENGVRWKYNSTVGAWLAAQPANDGVSVGNTAPVSPSNGDLWWNSDYATMFVYYNDGNSSQWVESSPGSSGAAKNNFTATSAPTVNDDSGDGYAVGSRWIWAARGLEWVALDVTAGAAEWSVVATQSSLARGLFRSLQVRDRNDNLVGVNTLGDMVSGTGAGRLRSTGSAWNRAVKVGAVSAASAGSTSGIRASFGVLNVVTGPGFELGGVFGISDASYVSGSCVLAGVTDQAFLANIDPSAQTNALLFGADPGDTQLTFMHNDGSGTCTKVTINGGTGFPANTVSTDLYLFKIRTVDGTEVFWFIKNLSTGLIASGTVNTNLPSTTVGLAPYFYRSNRATASAVTLEFGGYYELVYGAGL
jgi:hypothetical protein